MAAGSKPHPLYDELYSDKDVKDFLLLNADYSVNSNLSPWCLVQLVTKPTTRRFFNDKFRTIVAYVCTSYVTG